MSGNTPITITGLFAVGPAEVDSAIDDPRFLAAAGLVGPVEAAVMAARLSGSFVSTGSAKTRFATFLGRSVGADDVDVATLVVAIRENNRGTIKEAPRVRVKEAGHVLALLSMIAREGIDKLCIAGKYFEVRRLALNGVPIFRELGPEDDNKFIAHVKSRKHDGRECTVQPGAAGAPGRALVVFDGESSTKTVLWENLQKVVPAHRKPLLAFEDENLGACFVSRFEASDGPAAILCTVGDTTTIAAATDAPVASAVYSLCDPADAEGLVAAAASAALMVKKLASARVA